jgi:K+-transporting ATPase A subunit
MLFCLRRRIEEYYYFIIITTNVFIFILTWKAMFISAQLPFNLKATSECFVSSHNISTAPDSNIGSFAGENSSSKLQMVDVTTVSNSEDGSPFTVSKSISGRQTE